MEIVVCSDNNYIKHTAVMLTSLFTNNKGCHTVHLIGSNIGEVELDLFSKTICSLGCKLCYYTFDNPIITTFPKGTHHNYISSATYIRLFLQDILPATLNKVLYLDGDIIVTGSIEELWDTELGDNLVAATSDVVNGYSEYYERFGFPKDYVYFNAGVLLINLAKWRTTNLKQRALDYINNVKRPQLDNADQDVLNAVCVGKTIVLPLRFNLQDGLLREKIDNAPQSIIPSIDKELKDGRIFHFSCVKKPWNFRCIHPLSHTYFKYKVLTEWADERVDIASSDVFYMIFYWVAYSLGLTNRYRKSVKMFDKGIDIE